MKSSPNAQAASVKYVAGDVGRYSVRENAQFRRQLIRLQTMAIMEKSEV